MKRLWLTLLVVYATFKTCTSDRRFIADECDYQFQVDHQLPDALSVDQKVYINEQNPPAGQKVYGLKGTFFDNDFNRKEHQKWSNHGPPTVADNKRLDIEDEKKQIKQQPKVLFQEGRSFCISGEHFKNSETLMNYPEFKNFGALAKYNFDIGTHTHPDDYEQMNIHPWSTFDFDQPDYPFMHYAPNPKIPTEWSDMYYWEPSTDVFFHTRITDPGRKPGDDGPDLQLGKVSWDIPDRVLPPTAGFYNRPAQEEKQPNPGCRNPYFIQVTEMESNGIRMHNWLHITLYVSNSILKLNEGLDNCATGAMKWVMVEVRDGLGLPIGDFNTEVPCEMSMSCKCKSKSLTIGGQEVPCNIVHGTRRNSMPCMFTPLRSVTQPGLFIYGPDAKDPQFTELHLNWHFAQHTSYFASELHFAAVIVEDSSNFTYYTSRQTKYSKTGTCRLLSYYELDGTNCEGWELYTWSWSEQKPDVYEDSSCTKMYPLNWDVHKEARNNSGYYSFTLQHMSDKTRPYGWTPQYRALAPTIETLGAWDRFDTTNVEVSRLNCHRKISSRYYEEKTFKESQLPVRDNLFKWNESYSVWKWNTPGKAAILNPDMSNEPWGEDKTFNKTIAVERASTDTANFFSVYQMESTAYETMVEPYSDNLNSSEAKVSRFYFGTAYTKDAYKSYKLPPVIKAEFDKMKTMEDIANQERCACPRHGPTEDPSRTTEATQILQGRATHATQMLLAWVVLVPIAFFVIRYYKETYMKVFLLHEFWWYSVHFLCLATALLFMIGGILAVEYKRMKEPNWTDELLAHVVIGLIAIILFVFHLVFGAFRFYPLKLRMIQIALHFGFGVLEYLLAVTAIILAAWIPQGRMPCSAFATYMVFLFVQIVFYIFMEFHSRYVDNMLHLHPPRSYNPTPAVRVFHRTAPLSKFRLIILGVFATLCWIFYVILRIEIQQGGASCFNDLGNDYDEDIYENF